MLRRRVVTSTVRVCLALCTGWAITAAFSGCGSGDGGPERAVVSGTVAYNGKPVAEGRIRFMPVASSQSPVSGAYIVDGHYEADSHGGIPVGTHNVQIEAYSPTDPAMLPDLNGKVTRPGVGKGGLGRQYLPQKHNVDSQLQITIEPGSRNITKNFDLTD